MAKKKSDDPKLELGCFEKNKAKIAKLNEPYVVGDYQHRCEMVGCHAIANTFTDGPNNDRHYYCQIHFQEIIEHGNRNQDTRGNKRGSQEDSD